MFEKYSTVDELQDDDGVEIRDDFMVNGVRFIEVQEGHEVYYRNVNPEGEVSDTRLTDPREFGHANYTFARIYGDGEKVMVDDDGIHQGW